MGALAVFGITNDGLNLAVNLLLLFLVVLWFALVYWTYADARRRIEDPMLVGCATAASFFPFIGTVIYLIVRPPEVLDESRERELELAVLERELRSSIVLCPNCRNLVEKDYLICPVCNWDLKKPCVNCEKPLNMEWDTCPYCTTDQRSGKRIGW
jgi:RNA polymerase subunit RPABC4/transcription elongation factor Spt4